MTVTRPGRLIGFAGRYRLEAGFVAGVLLGLLFGDRVQWLRPLGDLFIVALQLLGPPLALLVLVSALVSISGGRLGRMGLRSTVWYLSCALAAAMMGVAFASLLGAGTGLSLGSAATMSALQAEPATSLARNPPFDLAALIHGPAMIAVFVAVYLAVLFTLHRRSRLSSGENGWRGLLDHATQAAFRLLAGLMLYAPLGILAITAVTVATLKLSSAAPLLTILLAAYLAQLVVGAGCLLAVRPRLQARGPFLRAAREPLLTALITGSSAATLPLEFRALEQRLGLSRTAVGVVLPLGLAMYKVGTAVHQAVILVFAATAMGHELTLAWLGTLTLLAALASVITPPVSGGSAVALALVFGWIGLPVEAIAIGIAIPLLGKLNTPLNSLGRLAAATVLISHPALPAHAAREVASP